MSIELLKEGFNLLLDFLDAKKNKKLSEQELELIKKEFDFIIEHCETSLLNDKLEKLKKEIIANGRITSLAIGELEYIKEKADL